MKTILDRTTPPVPKNFTNRPLPTYRETALSNGIEVYFLQYGNVEVAEVQAVFKAGKSFQPKIGLAGFTARNLMEGTANYSSHQLAQKLDDHGAWISNDTSLEFISVNLTTLERHLEHTLPLLHEVLVSPTFPQEEFENMRFRSLQKMQVQAQKTAYVAQREFGRLLLGKTHPYGMHTGPEELKALTRQDLVDYHKNYLRPATSFFTVVGRFDEDQVLKQLDTLFGQVDFGEVQPLYSAAENTPLAGKSGRRFFEQNGSQATIRLGHLGFKRSHPSFYKMELVNTILGGYFGSRLMKNIREDKGYTYGIYSGWLSYKHGGYFLVQSDVGNEYVEDAIREIKKEMTLLMEKGVGKDEFDLVKNYTVGRSISQRETPFQLGNILRFSIVNGISFKEMDNRFDIIRDMQAEEVVGLANKYLRPHDLLEVVCGDPQ